jgi:gamma-glutamyltranspeptidase
MDVDATVSLPCIHHQWLPDELRANGWGLDALTLQDLHLQGHKIKETAPLG